MTMSDAQNCFGTSFVIEPRITISTIEMLVFLMRIANAFVVPNNRLNSSIADSMHQSSSDVCELEPEEPQSQGRSSIQPKT